MDEGTGTARRIAILNPKGGSGKTTLATNLAAYYASRGFQTALMDFDPQGSSGRWLKTRPATLPGIHGVAACDRVEGSLGDWVHEHQDHVAGKVCRFPQGTGQQEAQVRELELDGVRDPDEGHPDQDGGAQDEHHRQQAQEVRTALHGLLLERRKLSEL